MEFRLLTFGGYSVSQFLTRPSWAVFGIDNLVA